MVDRRRVDGQSAVDRVTPECAGATPFTKMQKIMKNAAQGRGPDSGMPHQLQTAKAISYLTKEETARFFSVIPVERTRDRLLFDLIYRHGLRRHEATLIERAHLSDGRIWITRVKGGVSGEYPVHPITRRLLWEYLAADADTSSPFLFPSRQVLGAPISPSLIYHLFRAYAAAAELPANRRHVHVLRHSIAVHFMNAGSDVSDVQDWLGHRAVSSTLVYARITNKRRDDNFERMLASGEIAAWTS